LLNQASKISDLFIDGNKLLVYTKGRDDAANDQFFAYREFPYEKIPLIILVNRGSASASEIVAGAVQDWDRGLIAGETTFGKGVVQRPFLLSDNSVVRITISKYYTPSGRAIQRDYNNKEDYYAEIMTRTEEEGNNINHEFENDSSRTVFTTKHGRTVYGDGGITPDFIFEQKNISEFAINLRRENIYYKFIRSYLDSKGDYLKSIYADNLKKFISDFNFSNSDVAKFLKLAENSGVEINYSQFNSDKEYILNRLKAYIARDFWKSEGWYTIMLGEDYQFTEALKLLPDIENFLEIN